VRLYIEATYTPKSGWYAGETIGCWTTERPGWTGPRRPWWWYLSLARIGWRVRLRITWRRRG
jgi:hypothetical protein